MSRSIIRSLIFIASFLLFFTEGKATHIVGGNLAYEYLGPVAGGNFRYKVIFTTYIDCNSRWWLNDSVSNPFPEGFFNVGVYQGPATPASNLNRVAIINMPLIDSARITPMAASNCLVGSATCIYEVVYERIIDLPLTMQGYHLFYDRCCRVDNLENLTVSGNQGLSFHAYIPPSLVANNSPVFSDLPVPFICVGDTASILNTATDADGDQLVFSFENPYKGFGDPILPNPTLPGVLTWPIPIVNYFPGYDKNTSFGASGYSYINSSNGYSEYYSPTIGEFVVAVEIKEYRSGNLIGITRRDMQLLIISCPVNPAPKLSKVAGSGQKSYTITEGDSLCFPITMYDQLGDTITLSVSGQIFDPLLVNPAATNTPATITADSIATSQVCWKTDCGQARALPYTFSVIAKDNGCPNKTSNLVYSIQVNPFQGPPAILGEITVCPFSSGVVYSVASISGAVYTWNITGGTIISGNGTNSVVVDWAGLGMGHLQVVTSYKTCFATPLDLDVIIDNLQFADAGADVTVCSGSPIQIGSAPITGAIYRWSPVGGLNDTTVSNPMVLLNTFGSTNQYVVTATNAYGCIDSDTILVNVFPASVLSAGVPQSICLFDSVQLFATPGFVSYLWSPAATISDPTISNPFVKPLFPTTYVLVAMDTNGCSTIDSVQISIFSLPVVIANASSTDLCQGDTTILSASGALTYTWSPVSSLSNPSGSITNAFPPATTEYILEGTDINGCKSSDSILVNVFFISANDTSLCLGDSIMLSVTSPGATSYSWLPATGLSSASIANPMASPAINITYTVTANNSNGCVAVDQLTVVVNDSAYAYFTYSALPSCESMEVAFTNLSISPASYFWNFGDGTSSTEINPVHNYAYSQSDVISLVSTNVFGCKDTFQLTNMIAAFGSYLNTLFPNVFSPNNDGINDILKIDFGSGAYNGCTRMQIYDRWGLLVFDSPSYNINWDGRTTAGVEVSDGVYYYVYTINDITLKGFVQVVR